MNKTPEEFISEFIWTGYESKVLIPVTPTFVEELKKREKEIRLKALEDARDAECEYCKKKNVPHTYSTHRCLHEHKGWRGTSEFIKCKAVAIRALIEAETK